MEANLKCTSRQFQSKNRCSRRTNDALSMKLLMYEHYVTPVGAYLLIMITIDSHQSLVAIMDATANGKDEEKVIAGVTRDPTYFFEDSFIVLKVINSSFFRAYSFLQLFQVENTLFRIQLSILLRHSGLFRDLYRDRSLPPTFTEANPFVVNDITVQELRHFLRITLPFETEDL